MRIVLTEYFRVTQKVAWELNDERLKEFQSYSPDLEGMSWEEIMSHRNTDFQIHLGDREEYLDSILQDYFCEGCLDDDAEILERREDFEYEDDFIVEE